MPCHRITPRRLVSSAREARVFDEGLVSERFKKREQVLLLLIGEVQRSDGGVDIGVPLTLR